MERQIRWKVPVETKRTTWYLSIMKKLILSVMALAFAVAVQAGDSKTGQDKDKPACCAAKAGAQAKATCPMAGKGKTACAAGACEKAPVKTALLSPKAASEAGR